MGRRSAKWRRLLARSIFQGTSTRPRRFRPGLEPLEDRRLLAAAVDLATISGRVFDDFTGNGFDAGEQVAGAMLDLYRDDGDGQFEPSTDDTAIRMAMTAADGTYQFQRLSAGGYFVLQPEQQVLGLQRQVSPRIAIGSEEVKGRITTTIDSFDATTQSVLDDTRDNQPVTSSIAAPEAIGGERDLLVNKTSVNGAVQLSVDSPLLPDQLTFDSIQTGAGDRRITWDGIDGDALTVNDTGLGGVNLTTDAFGVQLQIRADLAGGNAIVRLYSDDGAAATADRFSTATIPIPATTGTFLSAEFIPFSDFAPTSGGGADFTSIDAIELEVTGAADVNGAAELVGAVGATLLTQNFDNFESANLSLTKSVGDQTPTVGQEITFTVNVANSGPDNATGVMARDLLPSGLQFTRFQTANGSYDPVSGLWNIGSIVNGAAASLEITAMVTSVGTKINTAEITASDQVDPNSTPDNDIASEDDQASVTVVPETIDLSLTKTVSNPAANVGETVSFVVSARNDGPDTATSVAIRDLLPTGLALVSATPERGNYNTTTGIWNIPSLADTETVSLTLAATVTAPGTLTNTAEVIAADQSDIDSSPNNNVAEEDDQASISVTTPTADLSLSKQVDNSAPNVGDEIFFTVALDNAGPDPASGVTVSDLVPTGLTPISSTVSAGVYDTVTGIWDVGNISVGMTATLTIRSRVDSAQTSTNTAQIAAADQFDPDSTPGNSLPSEDDQASATVSPAAIDLSVAKAIDTTRPNVNDEVVFTIDLANAGPDIATGILVSDPIPDGLAFVSATESSGTYDPATGIWSVASLVAGSSATLAIRVQVVDPSPATNTASVLAADQFDVDSTPGNNIEAEDDQASVSLTLASADLSLTKTVDNPAPNVGQTVSFTVNIANAGPDTATEIDVRDQLPAGASLVSANETLGSYDAATGIWSIDSLVAGGGATLTLVATAESSGLTTNTAEIIAAAQNDPDSTPGNGVVEEDDLATADIQSQQIDLSLSKTISDSSPNLGSEASFTVTIVNAGPSAATGVVVTDNLPAGLTLTGATPSVGSFNTTTGAWTVGPLGVGQQETLQLVTRVDQVLVSATNTAQVTAAGQPDVDSTPNNDVAGEDDQASVTFSTPLADLSVNKSVSNPSPNIGDLVTFEIRLLNEGPDTATGIVVTDALPDGLQFVSTSLDAGTYDAASGLWSVPSLAGGATAMLGINATVETQGQKVNTARVTAADQADPDSTAGNNVESEDDQDSTALTPAVIDLSLAKTAAPARPAVGDTVTFTVTANNAGPADATGVTVADSLPSGITLVDSQTANGSFTPVTGIWNIGDLAAGDSATLVLTTTIDTAQPQTNTVEVSTANQFDSDSSPGNGVESEDDFASVTVTPASADLSLTKAIDRQMPNVGQEVAFTLTASNAGPDAAENISIRDLLPNGLSFVSASPSAGDYDAGTGIWTIASLEPASTATLVLRASVDSLGDKTNTAEILSSSQIDPDSTPGNNVDSEDDQDSVTLSPQLVDLALSKMIDEPSPNVGDAVVYTLELTNAGPSTATGVQVSDELAAGVSFESSTASQGSYDPATGIWTVGTVAVGETPTLEIRVTVGNVSGITNIAEILAADQPDSDSTPGNNAAGEDDQDGASFTTRVADLSLSKTVDDATPDRDQNVNFSLTLSNAGPDDASGVVVSDLLPSGLMFVSASPSVGAYDPQTGDWTINGLAADASATLLIEAGLSASTTITNTAEVTATNQFDPDSTAGNGVAGEDDISEVTVTPPVVDISVNASVDNQTPLEGDVITITIETGNSGPANASGIAVRAALPDGLTLLSAQPQSGDYNASSGLWTIGALAADASTQLTITARVDQRGLKEIPIEVVATDQFDIDSTPNNNVTGEDDQTELVIQRPGC